MNDIKLSVTIELPGSTMLTSQVCEENTFNYQRNYIKLNHQVTDPKTKKTFYKTETIEYKTRKCKPAYQVINMSKEAYEDMISTFCPEGFATKATPKSRWKSMKPKERLNWHLNRICESLQGVKYSYMILGE